MKSSDSVRPWTQQIPRNKRQIKKNNSRKNIVTISKNTHNPARTVFIVPHLIAAFCCDKIQSASAVHIGFVVFRV